MAEKLRCIVCEKFVSGKYRAECECYDEYAMYCRPGARGPGCPAGGPMCKKCFDGN